MKKAYAVVAQCVNDSFMWTYDATTKEWELVSSTLWDDGDEAYEDTSYAHILSVTDGDTAWKFMKELNVLPEGISDPRSSNEDDWEYVTGYVMES